jgi:hypothetical protein
MISVCEQVNANPPLARVLLAVCVCVWHWLPLDDRYSLVTPPSTGATTSPVRSYPCKMHANASRTLIGDGKTGAHCNAVQRRKA